MYGLVVQLEIDEAQAERVTEFLHNVAVPMISARDRVRRQRLDALP